MTEVTVDMGGRSVQSSADRLRRLVARPAAAAAAALGLALAVAAPTAEPAKAEGPPSTSVELEDGLTMPAQGRLLLRPGEMTVHGVRSKAYVIQVADETIVAPVPGLVVFAGEFRTYGQLLIISAGEGYHVLVGGLAHIGVKVGQSVSAGGWIGQAGKGAALTMELRRDGQPLDGTERLILPKSAPAK